VKKLILISAVLFALAASVTAGQVSSVIGAAPVVGEALASKSGPIVGTIDSCAAVFTEDAQACGSGGGSIVRVSDCFLYGGVWMAWWFNRNTGEHYFMRCY
jgi:hypothetical protein